VLGVYENIIVNVGKWNNSNSRIFKEIIEIDYIKVNMI
jgi:hypothetical protein